MSDRTVHIRYKENPVLLDKVLQELQRVLLDRLPWLDYAFGRAYKLVEHRPDGGKFIYPAAYNGNAEYVSLLPNDEYGNFSWFDVYDPQKLNLAVQGLPRYDFSGAVVFWYDMRTINADEEFMCSEEVKNQVLQLFTTPGIVQTSGRIEVNEIYERFENIYSGYSLEKIYNNYNYNYSGEGIQDIDKQFFMYPYAGLRIEFNLTVQELCYTRVK